jgi:crotonobetainyl-CoA:carnitine CoA-transferase CaiB-like acyl-CoA transferase
MQAEAGFMTLTGEPDGPPVRFGLSMVDFMTGSVFALGIVSAILGARASGKGCDVDVSLFDVALHQTSYPAVWAMNEGHQVGRPAARGASVDQPVAAGEDQGRLGHADVPDPEGSGRPGATWSAGPS